MLLLLPPPMEMAFNIITEPLLEDDFNSSHPHNQVEGCLTPSCQV